MGSSGDGVCFMSSAKGDGFAPSGEGNGVSGEGVGVSVGSTGKVVVTLLMIAEMGLPGDWVERGRVAE